MEISKHLENTNGEGKEIHEFIDQFFNEFGHDHRVVLHHKAGMELMLKKFGESAKPIILQHFLDDEYGGLYRGIPLNAHDPIFRPKTDKYPQAVAMADKILQEGI